MVIGGRPGISITCEPTGAGAPGAPSGGGGGAGAMPLLVWMVMTAPGIVWPLGVGPTTSPYFALLLIDAGCWATWKPESCKRCRAASTSRPATLGTREPGPPSTYSGSVGGIFTSPKRVAVGFIAVNPVLAGSLSPARVPSPQ